MASRKRAKASSFSSPSTEIVDLSIEASQSFDSLFNLSVPPPPPAPPRRKETEIKISTEDLNPKAIQEAKSVVEEAFREHGNMPGWKVAVEEALELLVKALKGKYPKAKQAGDKIEGFATQTRVGLEKVLLDAEEEEPPAVRVNPKNVETRNEIGELKTLIKQYQDELSAWEKVEVRLVAAAEDREQEEDEERGGYLEKEFDEQVLDELVASATHTPTVVLDSLAIMRKQLEGFKAELSENDQETITLLNRLNSETKNAKKNVSLLF